MTAAGCSFAVSARVHGFPCSIQTQPCVVHISFSACHKRPEPHLVASHYPRQLLVKVVVVVARRTHTGNDVDIADGGAGRITRKSTHIFEESRRGARLMPADEFADVGVRLVNGAHARGATRGQLTIHESILQQHYKNYIRPQERIAAMYNTNERVTVRSD
jgi:hypothetical protein